MATLNSWALTNLADVKESLGIASSDSSWDNLIIRKVNQATDMIEGWCGLDTDHHLAQTTYTNEEYDGTGTQDLFLRAKPVTSVTDLGTRTSNQNISNWDTLDTEDYFISEHGGLIKSLHNFITPFNSYRISYVAGYNPIPSDLAEACVILASYLVDSSGNQSGVKVKREGGRSVEYFESTTNKNTIEELGLDDTLARYAMPSLAGW